MGIDILYILIAAFFLDSLLGDPRGLPHLIVAYGNLITWGEKHFNKNGYRFKKGMVMTFLLVSISFLLPNYGLNLLADYPLVYIVFSTVILFYCIANKTLVDEGKAVFNALHKKGLKEGRKRLAWIVGRDTSQLTAQQIRMATFETMAENLSDGVIAPLFYFVCLGVPGAMAYKMINTLDSMIGYRNERYEQFGKFAAILDDVVNFIPARLTALLMLVVTFKLKGLGFVFKEGEKHSSPNAGYPEAALAYILNCQFGGANIYFGKLIDKPFIGLNNRVLEHQEIKKVAQINYRVTTLFIVLMIIIFVLISIN